MHANSVYQALIWIRPGDDTHARQSRAVAFFTFTTQQPSVMRLTLAVTGVDGNLDITKYAVLDGTIAMEQ